MLSVQVYKMELFPSLLACQPGSDLPSACVVMEKQKSSSLMLLMRENTLQPFWLCFSHLSTKQRKVVSVVRFPLAIIEQSRFLERGAESQEGALFTFWILACILNFCYTLWWDMYMDWGVLDREYSFLREELVYPHKVCHDIKNLLR